MDNQLTQTPEQKISVRVGKIPGNITTVTLSAGKATVHDALVTANLDAEGFEIRVDASKASTQTPLKEGQTVLLVREIRGN